MVRDSLNRPLSDLRISVTDRCNFRCGYCMPKDVFSKDYAFLRKSLLLKYTDIERLVKIFAKLGVRKLRLTGGEPLLRKDLEVLIVKLAAIASIQDIAITTNASLLTQTRAQSIKEAGVNRVNISLDALTPKIYQKINEIHYPLQTVLEGIENALNADFNSVKVNMVVQKGVNDTDILPMVRHFRNSGVVLRFIEFMDVGNHNQWDLAKVFSSRQIIDLIDNEFSLRPVGANYPGEVAKRWHFVDGAGELGVISSITQPFCVDCTRARLSARGELFTCLFASEGVDLKKLIKTEATDDEILSALSKIWFNRSDQYSMLRSTIGGTLNKKHKPKVEMSYIGG